MSTAADTQNGFTLLEIMLVVIILSILAAIAIPRLAGSADMAREKADITTGKELKAALDRYQLENGSYPSLVESEDDDGKVTGAGFIPAYIKKLDKTVTQQNVPAEKQGFGIATGENPLTTNLIMIYLVADGSSAEVKVFHKDLSTELWSSE